METITDIAEDNMEAEPGWHVASSEYNNHPLLEFYLDEEDGYPFVFGRGKAKKLLEALNADKDRFVALLSAFVADDNWKEILREAKSSKGSENEEQHTGGWHVGSRTVEQHELLEFPLGETDQWPFTFGLGKVTRLYGALAADPKRFLALLSRFVDGGDWENMCVKGVYRKNWKMKTDNEEADESGDVLKRAIEDMKRVDQIELAKRLVSGKSE